MRIDIDNYICEKFAFKKSKTTTNGTNHALTYNNETDFFVQTPLCEVLEISSNHIKIQFERETNKAHFGFFKSINDKIFNFSNDIYPNTVYKNNVIRSGPYLILDTKLKKPLFFDSNKEAISSDDVSDGDFVLCLLRTSGLWADSKSTGSKWECYQIMKIEPP